MAHQLTPPNITWLVKPLEDLTALQVHQLLSLRTEVFIVEQTCYYQDADKKDLHSLHVLGYDNIGKLVACARIVLPGISYPEVSIGRVATHLSYRRTGLGRVLMLKTMDAITQRFGNVAVRISAQSYLIPFYRGFGFEVVGEEYLEDDIPHTEMLRLPP